MHGVCRLKFLKQTPRHTVNGAEVDRFPMEMIEARKVSTCHHRFKGLPSAIRASVSRGRFIPELDSLLLQPNTRPRRSSRRSAGPFARTIKKAQWFGPSHPANAKEGVARTVP